MTYELHPKWQEKAFELRNFQGVDENDSGSFSPEIIEEIINNPTIYDELMVANAILPYVKLQTKAVTAILYSISKNKTLMVNIQSIPTPSSDLGKRLLNALSAHVDLLTSAIKIIAVLSGEDNDLVSYSI